MNTSLHISIISATIAGIALGWNIVRDVILRPKLIVKLQAEIKRNQSRLEENDYEETFCISGTITPVKFRTTIEKLSLTMPDYPAPKKFGHPPITVSIKKIVDSGEPCEINWKQQSVLQALHKSGSTKNITVYIHHSAADKPRRKKLRLKTTC